MFNFLQYKIRNYFRITDRYIAINYLENKISKKICWYLPEHRFVGISLILFFSIILPIIIVLILNR